MTDDISLITLIVNSGIAAIIGMVALYFVVKLAIVNALRQDRLSADRAAARRSTD